MTTKNNKLDNDTVRRLSKLISGSKSNNNSTPIMTGTVVQNDNSLYVAIDDNTLVPISDTSATVNVGDVVTIALTDETGIIVGNNTDKSVATTNLTKTANGLKLDIEGKASKAELTLESDKLQSSITDTKKDLNNTITQTAEGLTVKITNAQDTADTAKTNAATAQTTADAAKTAAATAQTSADDARKVATNYLSFNSTDGLVVGDMTTTLGNNTQITSSGVNIRNGSTVLASFEDDEIALGKNSTNSVISLCNDAAKFKVNDSGYFVMSVQSNTKTDDYGTIVIDGGNTTESNYLYHSEASVDPRVGFMGTATRYNSSTKKTTHGHIICGPLSVQLQATGETAGATLELKGSDGNAYLNKSGKELLLYGEKVLYNNTTGTTSTVTLSESAANFTYLEIYYNYSTSNSATSPQFSTKVFSPNSKYVALEGIFRVNSATMQFLQETIQIKGTQILRTNTDGWWQNSNTTNSTITTGAQNSLQFYIQRVVGIK